MLRYFDLSEFDCSFTGENEMDEEFLDLLDDLRDICGFPFIITSGYRSPDHPLEAKKKIPGTHSDGIAADIEVRGGWQRGAIVQNAIELGFKGIGVSHDFIHVDLRLSDDLIIWTYGS